MAFDSSTIAFLVACLLVGGYLWNRGRWSKVRQDVLVALASGDNPRRWKPALRELQRRGAEVQPHIAHIASHLLAPSQEVREAAYAALSDLYPEWERHLAACGYQPTDDLQLARQKLGPVLRNLDTLTHPSPSPHAEP